MQKKIEYHMLSFQMSMMSTSSKDTHCLLCSIPTKLITSTFAEFIEPVFNNYLVIKYVKQLKSLIMPYTVFFCALFEWLITRTMVWFKTEKNNPTMVKAEDAHTNWIIQNLGKIEKWLKMLACTKYF